MHRSTRRKLLLGSCALPMVIALSPAGAQTSLSGSEAQSSSPSQQPVSPPTALGAVSQAAEPKPAEQGSTTGADEQDIVVTGSRTVTNGYSAPTPVTVITADQLTVAQPQSLSQGLNQSPQFRNSASPQSNGSGTSTGSSLGASYLNLRGLGNQRTLVLLDGHRLVPSSFLGPTDIGLLPEGLVSRVDVVTGGASAAYGSDAVSGVVNFALNTRFTGVKGVVQGGVAERGDNANQKVAITAGTSLFGGRGHLIANAEYYSNDGIPTYYGRDWALRSYAIISVPGVTNANKSPTNPRQVVVPNVRLATASYGGLITNTALRGTQFLPGGQPAPFAFGTLLNGSTMQGGDGPDAFYDIGLQPRQQRINAFGRFEYEFGDSITGYVQAFYGQDKVTFASGPGAEFGGSAFTIFADNAYLPQSIKTRMTQGNIASFTLGRLSRDFGIVDYRSENQTTQVNVGLKGSFGATGKWEVYYAHGENRSHSLIDDQANIQNLYRAADAVISPTTGQVVCRSTLTTPGDGCVPINLFGEGAPSAAALAYVTDVADATQTFTEDYAGFSVSTNLFDLPGGPLAAAAGGEIRWDRARQTSDALSTGIVNGTGIRGFPATLNGKLGLLERQNPQPFRGSNRVAEGFVELLAPVLKDVPFIHALDLNGAVRYANYRESGGVTTWKAGITYEPIPDIRFRATRSRDIRAPSLFELFLSPTPGSVGGPITDPFTNTTVSQIAITIAGNRNLRPERANTTSYGVVLRPTFLPGFGLSVDYWKVDISNAISQLFQSPPATNAQLLIDQCFAGNTALCDAIHRTAGVITSVDNTYFNISNFQSSGVDFEANYKVPMASLGLAGTNLSLRAVVTYLDKLSTQLPGGLTIDRAGDVGQSAAGSPHWAGTVGARLESGPFGLFLQERYIQGGKIDNTLTDSDISLNRVPAVWYTDATVTMKVGATNPSEFFLTINNLFDRDPPIDPRFLAFGTIPTNRSLYDVVGRQFTAGFRFRF